MKTVLIVDDSRTTRNYHGAIMSSAGYQIVLAADGAEGLEKALMQPCDLILTDINMEGVDGYEFIRRFRANPTLPRIPIVIVSSEGESKDKHRGFAAGADLYVVKPSEPGELLGYVRMMLGETQ